MASTIVTVNGYPPIQFEFESAADSIRTEISDSQVPTVNHKKVHHFNYYNKFVKCWLTLVIFGRNVA